MRQVTNEKQLLIAQAIEQNNLAKFEELIHENLSILKKSPSVSYIPK
jgi:hypothetical protein